MNKIVLFIFIIFSGFVAGQDLKEIKKTVAEVNQTKNYSVRIVPNSFFVDKNQVTDNGIELKGYYRNGQLKKMEHFVGLSAWTIVTEYFFGKEDDLIFVYTKKLQTSHENGYMKTPQKVAESRYYYQNKKLIKTLGAPKNKEENKDYLYEAEILKKDLKEYK